VSNKRIKSHEAAVRSSDKLATLHNSAENPMGRAASSMTRYRVDNQGSPPVGVGTSSDVKPPVVPPHGSIGMAQKLAVPYGTISTNNDMQDSRISSIFDSYRDPDEPDLILAPGVQAFCRDLRIPPEDYRVLLFAWKTDATVMCRFTRKEFIRGFRALRCDSVSAVSSHLLEVIEEVRSSPERFHELYRWTYQFALDKDCGQRVLPVELATGLWRIVFTARSITPPAILDPWLDFLEKQPPGAIRSIPRDTWDMFLKFVDVVGDDLANYNDEEAWPSLLDDFVEYENDRRNQNLVLDRPRKDPAVGDSEEFFH